MFRAFDAGACVGDDRRSAMPAVRGVVALLNRLSAGERTASCFAPEARLREGPFPGITATRTTLDAQLEVVAREYEIDAWAEAVNLSADGQVLVSGVHAAKPLALRVGSPRRSPGSSAATRPGGSGR